MTRIDQQRLNTGGLTGRAASGLLIARSAGALSLKTGAAATRRTASFLGRHLARRTPITIRAGRRGIVGLGHRAIRWTRAIPPAALPILFSLAVHGGLMLILLSVTWTSIGGGDGGYARAEVVISLPAAPPAAHHPPPTAGTGDVVAPARFQSTVPRLQGLSTPALSALPTLRSAASGHSTTPAELLRNQDDSFIGGASFAGLGTRQASSVVYVVDASGAMITSLQFVLAELERSVRNLSASQQFQVVLFRERPGTGAYEVFLPPTIRDRDKVGLIAATPANKVALADWLKTVRPTGRSNPLEGLRRGLTFKPDAIFLLSRSIRRSGGELSSEPLGGVWGQPTQQTLAELERLNPRSLLSGNRRVVVKAIQFLEEDPSGTMQAIGDEHGDGPGSYSVLSLEALRERGNQ